MRGLCDRERVTSGSDADGGSIYAPWDIVPCVTKDDKCRTICRAGLRESGTQSAIGRLLVARALPAPVTNLRAPMFNYHILSKQVSCHP